MWQRRGPAPHFVADVLGVELLTDCIGRKSVRVLIKHPDELAGTYFEVNRSSGAINSLTHLAGVRVGDKIRFSYDVRGSLEGSGGTFDAIVNADSFRQARCECGWHLVIRFDGLFCENVWCQHTLAHRMRRLASLRFSRVSDNVNYISVSKPPFSGIVNPAHWAPAAGEHVRGLVDALPPSMLNMAAFLSISQLDELLSGWVCTMSRMSDDYQMIRGALFDIASIGRSRDLDPNMTPILMDFMTGLGLEFLTPALSCDILALTRNVPGQISPMFGVAYFIRWPAMISAETGMDELTTRRLSEEVVYRLPELQAIFREYLSTRDYANVFVR